MRATALLVALLALTAAAQSTPRFKRFTQRTDQGRNSRGLLANQYAFFEAFPASGAGTTTACSTTAPTGAKGETLTFTRTGSATCTKTATGGLATTGIADGDLVTLAGNVARVEYDSAGVLGLRVESSRTNSLVRSEELTNAVWQKFGGLTVPTPDTVTAPDGATTADVVVVGASPTSSTTIYQSHTATASSMYTCTGYVKASSGSGTVYWNLGNNVDFTTGWVSSACSVTSSSWTRCSVSRTATSAVQALYVGSDPGGARVIASGFNFAMWGAQCEAGAYATSYIPTTTASAVRNAESAQFTISAIPTTQGSAAVSVAASGLVADRGWLGMGLSTSGVLRATATAVQVYSAGVGYASTSGVTPPARVAGYWGAATGACINSTCSTGGAATMPAGTVVGVFDYYAGTWGARVTDGIASRICIDPDPTRCR